MRVMGKRGAKARWLAAASILAACNGDDVTTFDGGLDGVFDDDGTFFTDGPDDGFDDDDFDDDDFDDDDFDGDDVTTFDGDVDDDFDDDFDDGIDLPNDCCAPSSSGSAGCDDAFCEQTVCEIDPFCCEGAWDGACAASALMVCPRACGFATTNDTTGGETTSTSFGTTDSPGSSSGFTTDDGGTTFSDTGESTTGPFDTDSTDSGTGNDGPDSDCCTASTMGLPGCTNTSCELIVCAADVFCCNATWDGICASAAQEACPATCGDGSTSDETTGTTGDETTGDETTGTTGDETGTTGGDPLDAFETPQPFGDQVQELDLIGTWNLPTDGSAPGYSMSLTIAADGSFVWEELDSTCMLVRDGSGMLWVAGAQLVMLFETFTGPAPWDVMSEFGWDAEAPFLIRAGYAPVLGHIAVTVTPQMRVTEPWNSLGYARTVGGTTGLDVWVAETELWDVAPGEMVADIVARDRTTLDVIAGPTATRTYNRWWYENGIQTAEPAVVDVLPYTDDMVGNLTLDGDAFTYVGARMASFEPGDNFQLDAPTTCP